MRGSSSGSRTKVLLVEDHGVVREGVAAVLDNLDDFELVGAVDSGLAAVDAVGRLRPDLLLLDLRLRDISGIEVMRRLRAAGIDVPVVVQTSSDSDHMIRQALALGARGYLLKSSGADALVVALRTVASGGRYVSPEAKEQLADTVDSMALSAREIQILRLASEGLTNGDIGRELEITERTVKFHLNAVFQKLGTRDRTAAVAVAMRRGILDP